MNIAVRLEDAGPLPRLQTRFEHFNDSAHQRRHRQQQEKLYGRIYQRSYHSRTPNNNRRISVTKM